MKHSFKTILISLVLLLAASVVYAVFEYKTDYVYDVIKEDLTECNAGLKEKACVVQGEGNWLYLQESLLNIVVPWKNNAKSFIAFSDSLKKRNIKLVIVPVPDKLLTTVDRYVPDTEIDITPKYYDQWVDTLREHNVTVIDALDLFKNIDDSVSVFEPYESHCTAEGRQILAELVAESLADLFDSTSKKHFLLKDTIINGNGNLYHLLHKSYKKYKEELQMVYSPDGERYLNSKKAPIIIIGDSNTSEGKNASSHIGAYIAKSSGQETFTISKVGGGNIGTTLFKGRDTFLKGKKAVVWVFDGRELYGDFKMPVF